MFSVVVFTNGNLGLIKEYDHHYEMTLHQVERAVEICKRLVATGSTQVRTELQCVGDRILLFTGSADDVSLLVDQFEQALQFMRDQRDALLSRH